MSIQATLPDGFSVDLVTRAAGPILYNNGAGVFPFLGVPTYQFAFPKMDTSGTVILGDSTYQVSGTTWFDRQWMDQPLSVLQTDKFKWTWMNFRLNNGDVISLWDVIFEGKDQAWAIVVSPDGTHTIANVLPLEKDASDVWISPESGRHFPSRWIVKIPALEGVFEVTATPKGQEISGAETEVGRAVYEGACTITGSYKGEKVTGLCYTEMVGG